MMRYLLREAFTLFPTHLDDAFGTIRIAAIYYDKKPSHCRDVWEEIKERQDSAFKAISYLRKELEKRGLTK